MYNLIYLADDHAIVAAGIAHLLRSLTNTRDVNVFHSGNEILAAIEKADTEMFENMEELKKARFKSKKVTYEWNIINADNSVAEVNNEIKEKL